jgi:hypothetical protein
MGRGSSSNARLAASNGFYAGKRRGGICRTILTLPARSRFAPRPSPCQVQPRGAPATLRRSIGKPLAQCVALTQNDFATVVPGCVAFLRHAGFASRCGFVRGASRSKARVEVGARISRKGGCRAKTGRNFANDRAEQNFRDFFVSERSEASKKRTKQIRQKAGWNFYTASVESG